MMSPYTAMNNDPVSTIDPMGLQGFDYMSTPENEATARSVMGYYSAVAQASMGDVRDPSFRVMPLIYGGGASGGQITLYGAQAQAAWAMISGQEFKIPQGKAAGNDAGGGAPGFTRDQVTDAGWIIDKEDEGRFYAHRFTQDGDITTLTREGGQFLKTEDNEDWFDWNGPLMRYLVPDKLSFSVGGDLAAFLGVGAQPFNISILTRGKEPGVYLTPSFNVNVGFGAFVSGGFNFGASCYTGDPRNISANMLQGGSHGGMVTGGYIGELSIGGSYSNTNDGHGFINGSIGVGVGYGAFGGYQYQYTPGVGKLFGW